MPISSHEAISECSTKTNELALIYLLIASKHKMLLSVVLSIASVVIPYLAGKDLEIKHSQTLPETARS